MLKTFRGMIQARKAIKSAAIETLERRQLLTVALTSALDNVTVDNGAVPTIIELNAHFNDPQVTGTTVAITTPLGVIPLQLSDAATPKTVANYVGHITSGDYNNTLVYRSVNGFVIQGGDQVKSNGTTTDLSQFPTIPGEPGQSNVRGTIAMALSTGPNSGNTEWFINETDNSSLLDGTNDGGPFTVFGVVLYNGMTVADRINKLPTINQGTLNSTLNESSGTSLPILNSANGAVATNLVTTKIAVVQHVITTVSTDNPGLVVPSIDAGNNQLKLTYVSGASGLAHVTVTATDLAGNSVSQVMRVQVRGDVSSDVGKVVVGAGGVPSATFHQVDGTAVTISLKGPGTATLSFPTAITTTTIGKGLNVGGTFLDPNITITGGTAATSLNFTTSGGGKVGRIGDITSDADLKAINGKVINLDGDISITGSIKSITLQGANHGQINVGTGNQALTLKCATAFSNEMITSLSNIKTVTTSGWDSTSRLLSGLSAPTVGTITVSGSVRESAFTFTALNVTGLGKMTVKGDVTGTTIEAVGNIGSISAGLMFSDRIFAGVTALPDTQALPNLPTDFATVSSIKSISVKSGAGPTFANTNIAAELLGSINIGRVNTSNGGVSFGVAADKITSLKGVDNATKKKLSLKKLDDPAALPDIESKLPFPLGDIVIKLF